MMIGECPYCGRKRPASDNVCRGCGSFQTTNRTNPQDIPDHCHLGRTPIGELTLETFDNQTTDMVRLRLREGRELVADIYLARADIWRGVPPGTDCMPFVLDALTTALRDTHQEELIPRLRRETEAMRYRFVPDDPTNPMSRSVYVVAGPVESAGPPISGFHTRLYRALKGRPQGEEE